MQNTDRRYDIDRIRVIAIGLLIIYHTAIGFQLWGIMIGFITNTKSWGTLWVPMMFLNVWRIPLLFFVSGMGVYFSIRNRSWKQLLKERTLRIFIPFLFGVFCICPVNIMLLQTYYHMPVQYIYTPGHLWFLGNIFVYVLLLCPLCYYLKQNEQGWFVSGIRKLLSTPFGIVPVIAAFVAETMLIQPTPYELYAMTWHGFFLGLLAFFFGFCFVLSGDAFWKMLRKWWWLFLVLALGLFTYRFLQPQMLVPLYLLPAETVLWVVTVLALGNKFGNTPGKALNYLSEAAYPVYILHMIFLSLASMLVFRLDIDVHIQFLLVVLLTFAGCFGAYMLIKKVRFLRVLFGLKLGNKPNLR